MTKKNPEIFIEHILESIDKIKSFSKNISKEELFKNELNKYAIIRAIEIIGEAVKNLPADFRNNYPDIPWSKIAGMRDKLMHHYFGVDFNNVWKVIKEDIPKLNQQILKIKKNLETKNKKTA